MYIDSNIFIKQIYFMLYFSVYNRHGDDSVCVCLCVCIVCTCRCMCVYMFTHISMSGWLSAVYLSV